MSPPLRRGRPVEEGEVAAGSGVTVAVEEVLSAGVVLVHGLTRRIRACACRIVVAPEVGRDGGEMTDTGELDGRAPLCSG